MKKIFLLAALLAALLPACRNNSSPGAHLHEEPAVNADSLSPHEEGAAEQSTPVLLNNGEKWDANAETKEGIIKMTALIKELPDQPGPGDYHRLKIKMETEFNGVLQKCTMTGEAHNQLHNYLLPMKELIENLNSQDSETRRTTADKLKQHLAEYENFFR